MEYPGTSNQGVSSFGGLGGVFNQYVGLWFIASTKFFKSSQDSLCAMYIVT